MEFTIESLYNYLAYGTSLSLKRDIFLYTVYLSRIMTVSWRYKVKYPAFIFVCIFYFPVCAKIISRIVYVKKTKILVIVNISNSHSVAIHSNKFILNLFTYKAVYYFSFRSWLYEIPLRVFTFMLWSLIK
jgi:hypothetical protein